MFLSIEAPIGQPGGGLYTGTFEKQMVSFGNGASLIKLILAPFLDQDYVRTLSLGAIWNFCEGPELP